MDNAFDRFPFFIFFIICFISIYFIYSPVLHIPFYHHDIYRYSVGGFYKACMEDYGYLNMYIQVRPLQALLDCAHFKLAYTVQRMSFIRFECIMLISFFAALFAYWLMKIGLISRWISLLISILIMCLPAMQNVMLMGVDSMILTVLLAFIAYLLIERDYKIGGVFCLLGSFFMYPACSSFFLVPATVFILFKPLSEWHQTRAIVIRDSVLFLICCGLYFLIGKITQHYLTSMNFSANYAFKIHASDFFARIGALFKVFPSLWNIHYNNIYQAVFVYFIIGLGCYAAIKKSHANHVKQAVTGLIILLLLGNTAFLGQPTTMVFARILFVFQAMSILILVWALIHAIEFFRAATILVFVMLFFSATATANYTVAKSALNANMELNYISTYLRQSILYHKKIKQIHIIGPDIESKLNFIGIEPRDDAFHVNSTIYRQDVYYMVNEALKEILRPDSYTLFNCGLDEFQLMKQSEAECIKSAPKNSIIVTYSRQSQPVAAHPDMLIIDMTDIKSVKRI